ncbi:MAG TPA: tetratricopeptide repeat protein [Paracoccaceae bacterium]|nr:tetratricopeptide repeat protein [Paracoccaceae bacterium]
MRNAAKIMLALAVASVGPMPVPAQEAPLEQVEPVEPVEQTRPSSEEELQVLMTALRDREAANPAKIEERIIELWSLSGSDTADLLLRRGRDAMNKEDFKRAVEHFTALIDHAPDFAEAWNARATAYFMMDEYGLSIADIQHVLTLNPQHFGALAGLGIMLEQSGKEAEALTAFRASQRLNPHRDLVNEAVERLAPQVDGRSL